jgi:hypothetical protein
MTLATSLHDLATACRNAKRDAMVRPAVPSLTTVRWLGELAQTADLAADELTTKLRGHAYGLAVYDTVKDQLELYLAGQGKQLELPHEGTAA